MAGEDKAIASGVDQMRGKPHRGIDVKGAFGIERSHHRGEHGAEPRQLFHLLSRHEKYPPQPSG
ncbi:hypothetical protein I541_5553 [Mycobacteroides abscessus]|nr:hypothetical protein I541_5553 [Mycobacteroides abscessus]